MIQIYWDSHLTSNQTKLNNTVVERITLIPIVYTLIFQIGSQVM